MSLKGHRELGHTYANRGVRELFYIPYRELDFERNGKKVFRNVEACDGITMFGCSS